MPVQQNRTGQFTTIKKIKVLQLNKAADWLESSYSETESESEAALVVPQHPERTSKPTASTEIQARQLAEPRQGSQLP